MAGVFQLEVATREAQRQRLRLPQQLAQDIQILADSLQPLIPVQPVAKPAARHALVGIGQMQAYTPLADRLQTLDGIDQRRRLDHIRRNTGQKRQPGGLSAQRGGQYKRLRPRQPSAQMYRMQAGILGRLGQLYPVLQALVLPLIRRQLPRQVRQHLSAYPPASPTPALSRWRGSRAAAAPAPGWRFPTAPRAGSNRHSRGTPDPP